MRIEEISGLHTTLDLDPDEARVLAAACMVAAANAEGSELNESPLDAFGDAPMLAMLLDSYAALFEAASMASAAHFALPQRDKAALTLSAIRAHGTGARFLQRDESEVA